MNTEKKIIGGILIMTVVILAGSVFFLTKDEKLNVSEDQIVTRNGLHWHPKLKININGQEQGLEDGIGLGAVHQKLHTHTEDYQQGVVHMEMQGLVIKDDTKLGKFFQVWGKKFNSSMIFDKISGPEGNVKMFVNGKENNDFENYLMKDGDNIEIKYEQATSSAEMNNI